MLDYSENIKISKEKLDKIGMKVCSEYDIDKASRQDWEERNAEAMKLTLQVKENKTYPWDGASNVKFPLLTIAAIQFAARAYPAMISSVEPVKCRTNGADNTGEKEQRAERVGRHMSYQILYEDDDWEEQHDRLLMALPIMGTAFKKSYYNGHHNESNFIPATEIVVGYYTKSLESARRITHIIPLFKNEYIERVNRGIYNDIEIGIPSTTTDVTKEAHNDAHGLTDDDSDPPHIFLEQHRYLDLDGDGYEEPYIVTVHKDTQKVVRIVNRFGAVEMEGNKVISIKPKQFFTKYGFIPSPDGGFYDIGFGSLLGPLNESVNSVINQLVDAGTMSNLQSGFLGRGIRIKGGKNRFKPGEWKHVDNYGDDLRRGVFPMPVREPSNVLFSLLGMLVQYGERLSSSTDMMTGVNPGQNQAATTTQAVVEQGMKVFNGIFKRIHRSMGHEFKKLYLLNREYLKPYLYYEYLDDNTMVSQSDYNAPENDISPTSDPNIVSESQRLAKAEALRNASAQYYGYDRYKIEKRWLNTMEISGVEEILPDPKGPNAIQPPSDPKIDLEKARLEMTQHKNESDTQIAELKIKIEEMKASIDSERIRTEQILTLEKAKKTQAETEKIAKEIENEAGSVRGMETSPRNEEVT